MTDRLRQLWAARSLREQRMLLVMLALFVIVITAFGIVRPLVVARQEAATRLDQATRDLGQVRSAAALLRSARPGAASTRLALPDLVTQSATSAGFAPPTVGAQGNGAVRVTIASAKSPALFAWLRSLAAQGVLIDTLTIRTNPDTTLSLEANLRLRGA